MCVCVWVSRVIGCGLYISFFLSVSGSGGWLSRSGSGFGVRGSGFGFRVGYLVHFRGAAIRVLLPGGDGGHAGFERPLQVFDLLSPGTYFFFSLP